AYPDRGQRESNGSLAPTIAKFGVQNENAGEGLVGQIVQHHDDGKSGESRMRTQECQRPERISHVPGRFGAALRRKRFAEDKKAVHEVDEAKNGSSPEGCAQIVVSQQAAQRRTNYESKSKRCAEHAIF